MITLIKEKGIRILIAILGIVSLELIRNLNKIGVISDTLYWVLLGIIAIFVFYMANKYKGSKIAILITVIFMSLSVGMYLYNIYYI